MSSEQSAVSNQPAVVMFDSPEAATQKTVTGWVSRDGFFFGQDERTARYSGCTHRACEGCGEPVEKCWILCKDCRKKKADKRYAALPRETWDGETPLVLFDDDRYFFSFDEIEDYCEENEQQPSDLQLVICEPVMPRLFDATDYFNDDLPEDGEVPDTIKTAAEVLNKAIKESAPLSWTAGKRAAIIPEIKA